MNVGAQLYDEGSQLRSAPWRRPAHGGPTGGRFKTRKEELVNWQNLPVGLVFGLV